MKIDMHVHTQNVSSCGKVVGRDLVYLYKEAGYQGIIITDHYYDGFFDGLDGFEWEERIDGFLAGYREARRIGEKIGLGILLGMEVRFLENANDYLVYGIDEAFLKQNPHLYRDTLEQFKQRIQGKNILIYQAHPFRPGMRAANPGLIDGVEVFNGNMRHDSRNVMAYDFAVKNKLLMISGSDFHQTEDLGRGGIVIPDSINLATGFIDYLKENKNVLLMGLNEMTVKPNEITSGKKTDNPSGIRRPPSSRRALLNGFLW